MRDEDMMNESILNKSAYDEHGPYDLDYDAGPSRPTPKPYDDPYSDAYNAPKSEDVGTSGRHPRTDGERTRPFGSRDRDFSHLADSRGRGRGRGRGKRGTNVRGSFSRGNRYPPFNNSVGADSEEYDPRMPLESLPSPHLQEHNSYPFSFVPPAANASADPTWGYSNQALGQSQNQQPYLYPGPSYHAPYVQPSTFIQPHINPRFASAFGLRAASDTPAYTHASPASTTTPPISTLAQGWTEQWSVPVTDPTISKKEHTS